MLRSGGVFLLHVSTRILLFRNMTRLCHLQSIPCDLGLLFLADTISMASNVLVTEKSPDLFQSSAFCFLWENQDSIGT